MSKPIQTRIVEIDNSQGIHIPKSWLEQIGISGAVEIEVQGDRIVIRKSFYPTPTLPLLRGGSKKFTNDLGLLYLGQISADEQKAVLDTLVQMFAE